MDPDTDVIQQSIARDRAELASTIDALTRRLDVKQRLRSSVEQRVDAVRTQVNDLTSDDVRSTLATLTDGIRANPLPLVIAAAFVVGFLFGRLRGGR